MAIKFLNTVQVDTDVLYVDTTNSNVGIGTSSPSTYFTLDVNGSANFSSDIQVGRNATALSFDMNPGYDSGSYYLSLYKNQTNDGGILLKSKPTSGSAQNDWQIVNQGTTGDLEFYAYGLAGNAFILDRETGNLQLPEYGAGTLVSDASGNITVSSGGGAGGPYLPLSAGSSYPLTDTLFGTNTSMNGNGTYAGSMNLGNGAGTGEMHLTIGNGSTDNGYRYIDLVGDTTYTDYGLRIIRGNGGANTTSQIVHRGTGDFSIQTTEAANLTFRTSSSERMRIDANGNVGIGTTSPSEKLSISGVKNTAIIHLGSTTMNTSWVVGDKIGAIEFGSADSSGAGAGVKASISYELEAGTTGSTNSMVFRSAGTSAGTNNTERMRILSNGSVGIGTTSPGSLLHVDGSRTTAILQVNQTGAGVIANFKQGGSSKVIIDNNGNVGIGTTSPQSLLHIFKSNSGGIGGELRLDNDNSAVANKTRILFSDGNGGTGSERGAIVCETEASPYYGQLQFQTGVGTLSTKMVIKGNGNVGIGTTSPGEKLEVNGNIKIDSALLSNQENTDIDTGAEVVAQVAHATYTAAFFDFVVKKGTNVRSGTVYACHDGDTAPLVEFTETSTNDLGDTSDVVLSVDISGTNMRLLATVASDDWSVKSLIRAI